MSKQIMVRDYPKEELPRERFIRYGPESLSNTDLLAILIRTGTKNESVLQLAERVITEFGGLRALKEATLEELTKINGIGQTKAVQILAAIELGRRIMSLAYTDRYVIRTPQDGADYVMDEMRFLKQEHFVCLYLDTKNQVIHKQTVFIGSLNTSIVHPREVFREAIRRSAASIICLHNHPSGVRLHGARS